MVLFGWGFKVSGDQAAVVFSLYDIEIMTGLFYFSIFFSFGFLKLMGKAISLFSHLYDIGVLMGFCLIFVGFEANGDQADEELQVPAFKEYGLSELRKATNGFSTEYIVSESGEKAPNVVFRGKLENNRLVAVKRFSKLSWPDAQQFVVRRIRIFFSILFMKETGKMLPGKRKGSIFLVFAFLAKGLCFALGLSEL